MTFNNAAMQQAAALLQSLAQYGQLHSAPAGDGTAHVTAAARQRISWGAPSGAGSFMLAALITFVGGTPNGVIYSMSFWDSSTGGNFWGEAPLAGDAAFNAAGQFEVTAIDATGSAT